MKIKKARIKNFYSIEDLEIDLEQYKGITLIEGINEDAGGSNGAGKSSLVEAFIWGLTGKTIRKSNEQALINNVNKRNCMVELHLNNDTIIRRQKKPSFLELFVGEDNLTKESVPKTQEEIEKILGCNYKSLLCTSFFGQHNSFSFLDASPEDKRNIVNNFLNLDYILDKRKSVKELKAGYYQEAKSLLSIVKEHRRSIENIEKKKETIAALQKKYEDRYDEETLALSLEDVVESEKNNSDRAWHVKDLDRLIEGEKSRLSQLSKKLHSPDQVDNCTKCGQEITTPFDRKEAEASFAKHNTLFSKYQRERIAYQSIIKKLPITSKEYGEIQQYKDLCRDSERYEEFIADLFTSIAETEEKRTESDLMYEVMKFWEKAFSEQGVIKYVIRNILEYFNTKANYYLSYLCNNHYVIIFDEELNEKITCRGVQTQYISLSGGEKRKVNLAVLMALKDLFILNSSFDSNILFLDEIAENLDEKGIDSLYTLLQEIKKTKDIFVITHNKYLKSNLDSVGRISIIKSKGKTTLKRSQNGTSEVK